MTTKEAFKKLASAPYHILRLWMIIAFIVSVCIVPAKLLWIAIKWFWFLF